ncbi:MULTISPECIES: histidine phosphotransferase ChpT [Brevundimonas]|uniref:histidine phosphotransferase ChpT n=1 Tax=Brevundimonas TaxID=41275 RepID=UPI000F01D638|nr:histidine phosphotransferase family protein [Brevundimonas lutea]
MTSASSTDRAPTDAASAEHPDGPALASLIAGKLCHDFISPSGAISSGLDLLTDPANADMRDDVMAMVASSAGKLTALVAFARVAYGAATTAETFASDELKPLVEGVVGGGRTTLDWKVSPSTLTKAQARVLVNLGQQTAAALPGGGVATIEGRLDDGGALVVAGRAEGPRARLKAEALAGLRGEPVGDGLPGQWIQPHWLWRAVIDAGGALVVETGDGLVTLAARVPQ